MFEQTFKNIDDVLWKEAGSTTELDYTEQTSWIREALIGFQQHLYDQQKMHHKHSEVISVGLCNEKT
jgi:type I restriction enzyme M protein